MNTDLDDPLAARYEQAVELERDAWRALHAQPPGSAARARAWDEWTAALSRTNRAWRELSARRLASPGVHAGNSRAPRHARH